MDRFVELNGLSKQFHGPGLLSQKKGGTLAVDRVSFGIEKNSVFGLVGESGCGKTTLARALLYLDAPSSGEVWFDGTLLGDLDTRELRRFRRRMQIVFQDPNSALNPKMNILHSLEEGLINLGIEKDVRRRKITELLELVGISPSQIQRYPHEFSGGQKQRIVVARALSMNPEFLVLDEPVSNLDVSIQAQIINLLLDLKTEFSLTYLFISHDLHLVAYLSDRIAVMYQGRIVELSPTDELIHRPLHPYTVRLFSSVPGITGSILKQEQAAALPVQKEAAVAATGCPYYERCSQGDYACLQEEPHLEDVGNEHFVACLKISGVIP
jgi:oligopeptide/dipeptide ABC transporter ATP-binding protein